MYQKARKVISILFLKIIRHLNSEDVEARDGGLKIFQKLHVFFRKHFKTADQAKGEPLVSEQDLFLDIKQPFYSKEFINGTKEHETKTENYHPQKTLKLVAALGDLGKRTNYLTRVWRIKSKVAEKQAIMEAKFVLGL